MGRAAPDRLLGDPAESQRGLRRRDGGRARRLHAAARSGASARLPRRDIEATRCRNAHARADAAGTAARHDYEYKRNGVANLFMLFAPLEGWRHVEVTERRTAVDYAGILRDLADIHFPNAEKIVLVQDNLNTHTPASFV